MKSSPQSGKLVEFGPYGFDMALGKLSKQGTPTRLSGMPLKILQYLVERPGEAVSRGELQTLLWNGAAYGDFEKGLNTAVNVVRRTLNDSADRPRYIETLPGQGYRFIAPICVKTVVEEAAAPPVLDSSSRNQSPPSRFQWVIGAALAIAALGGGAWWAFKTKPLTLIDGSAPSSNRAANDQYNLAFHFLAFQNDIQLSRKTIENALELDPHFASARLAHATMLVIEIYSGYSNDGNNLLRAEEELHQAEQARVGSDDLLVTTQAGVYFAQGRLDRVPLARLEELSRRGGDPTWLVLIRMVGGQIEQPLAIMRERVENNPTNGPSRMFLGELLRMKGDPAGAIQALQRVLQQSPSFVPAAWFLTMAYLDAGKLEQARALLEGLRASSGKNYAWRHAWAILLAAEGKRDEARLAMDEETLKFARLTFSATSSTADFYALQGDRTKAIEWLQLAIARGDERVTYFRRNPRLATLRDDPRFQSLLNSLEARPK